MDVLYRPAVSSDLTACAEIEKHAPDIWSEAGIQAALAAPASRCYVGEHGGKPVAFCSLQTVCDEASLNTITVLPQYRRCGIAKGLLSYAFGECRPMHIYLEVRSANSAAIKLYTSLGFTPVGLRRAFYTLPLDDAIIMTKGAGK